MHSLSRLNLCLLLCEGHHSSYQIIKQKLFFVSRPGFKMLCSVYYQSQVYNKHFCLTVRLENIPWRLLVTTIYTWCTSIMHWSENIFCFVTWPENILQFSLTVRLKNMILGDCQSQELLTYSEKHLLFNIRLLWFWNHGMVHVCLYICLCIYCFLHYTLFSWSLFSL